MFPLKTAMENRT